MEDARREFQVFLSPSLTKVSESDHRIIPVINKFMNSSNSTFMLTNRKSNVYKAVSGVSFQESDEKCKKKDKKRHSMMVDYEEIRQKVCTRRSRSLTSMDSTDDSKKRVEITHPFAPIIIQSRGRQGRYTKSKDKRKVSASKNQVEGIFSSNTSKSEKYIIPRRSRSASRSRKYELKIAEPEIIFDNKDAESEKDSCKYFNSHQSDSALFQVSDTDWKKYDAIVSEKLNSMLNDEPEGGYFSLERDENEEFPADSFQQDYYNESIYVSQALRRENSEKKSIAKSSNMSECHYPDDEGLYEEICDEDFTPHSSLPIFLKNENHDTYLSNKSLPRKQSNAKIRSPSPISRIEQGPTSTVVYISSNDSPYKPESNSSSDNFQANIMEDFINSKRNIFESSYFASKDAGRRTNRRSSTPGKFSSKVTLPIGNTENNQNILQDNILSYNREDKKAKDIRKSKSTGHFDRDLELYDLDLDMFTPKKEERKRHTEEPRGKQRKTRGAKVADTECLTKFTVECKPKYNTSLSRSIFPSSFKDFLTDSIFNPPEPTSLEDEPLIIKEDQIITCISDSSSDESDEESTSSNPWLEATNDFEFVNYISDKPPKSTKRRKKGTIFPNMFQLPISSHINLEKSNDTEKPERPSRSKHRSKSKLRKENEV